MMQVNCLSGHDLISPAAELRIELGQTLLSKSDHKTQSAEGCQKAKMVGSASRKNVPFRKHIGVYCGGGVGAA